MNEVAAVGEAATGHLPARLRRERMLEVIRTREFVRVTELSHLFGVSEVTVRTDLDALAGRNRIRRVRGGAVARPPAGAERPFEETRVAQADEKLAIARAASAMVRDGETIILDVGTTTTAIAHELAARPDLRDVVVFTNSLTIALELEPAIPRLTVVVTGGTLRPLQHSLVDPMGSRILETISAGTLFLGCNGVDVDAGVTNINLPEASIKQRMLGAAQQRVVVADGSKIGAVALARLCDVDDVDVLLTGASADQECLHALAERGLSVQVADPVVPSSTTPSPDPGADRT